MKVLFTPITSSSIAHITRCFAIAEILVKRGAEVRFTACKDKVEMIENEGYKVVASYPVFNLNDPKDQSVNYLESHKKELVEWFQSEIDATKEYQPDVVITSPGFFGPYIYYATGIPVISLMNGQYVPSSRGLMGISMSDDSLRSKLLRNALRPVFNAQFIKKYLTHINDAMRQTDLDADFADQAELYDGMHVLIAGDEEFEPQSYKYNDTKHIGPIFWEGFENDEELTDEFLEKFKGDDKLIVLNFGGSVFELETYKSILNIIDDLDTKLIVALGPNFDRELFPNDSKDLLIRRFIPGLRVSKHADLLLNTGSQGAIMQALVNGTPVVAFPVGIDQAFFANRLDELGVGINVNKVGLLKFSKRESYIINEEKLAEPLKNAVLKVLEHKSYKKAAKEYAKRYAKRHYDGANAVVEFAYELVN